MARAAGKKSRKLETLELDLHPNEASDLLPIEHRGILDAHGWDLAFWTVLDEGYVERSMAAIGHCRGADRGAEAWEVARPSFHVGAGAGKTEDAEACARRDGYVYAIGSHYGSKSGPIEKKRAFLARFDERAFADGLEGGDAEMEVALNGFRLHRAMNDALRAFGPPLLDPGPRAVKRFVSRARKKAGKKAAQRISKRDVPINIEGAAFTADGSILLGLRHPTTADGHPIVAEVAGLERAFDDKRAAPVARRFWVIAGAGSRRRPVGIRAMHLRGRDLHVITGSLESEDDDAVLLEERPEGGRATCAHHRARLPAARDGGTVEGELVHDFRLGNVEGLAADSRGRFHYVTDEDDRVQMRYVMEATPRSRSRASRRSRSSAGGAGSRSVSTGRRKSAKG